MPKSLKRRKTATLKRENLATQLTLKQRNKHNITERTLFTKRKNLKQQTSIWRVLTLISLLSLLTIILVVPALIVTPFMKGNQQTIDMIEKSNEKETKEQYTRSPLSVAVMRTNNDQIENVPLEQYVAGVVASEMPVDKFEIEALKAQGIAARTYIVNHILLQSENTDADVTDTTADQVYKSEEELRDLWGKDYNSLMEKLTEAITATEGEILTYKNKPVFPAFFSTSNGYTENSEDYWETELPHLRSVPSPWDEESPQFLSQEVFTFKEIEDALHVKLPRDRSIKVDVTRTKSKRVDEFQIEKNKFSGREVREKLGLKSSDFTIEQNNDHLIFTTKGFGHGIGMSQYGANGMAKEGKTYQEIVGYYYQGVEISTVTEAAPTLVSK